ncbi:PREDICTED: phosphatidylinositol 5-phosphate 4-kinase type-2 beta-like isoform X2 [Amphimedon queenslandica]|uniref:1-phosphatidylinositol-5-phosphate 4-kinase n=1 Tax=Amphimedon queenslandica TaxID=400682 RepID=A0A1X7VLT1_AMPQE|nr:PREDICTED: phosphatidylinositol 5-phosphate 4-kinase type-2 beta-like isoform X2 [Amphimedon queenslandica]|eukprot:XP_019863884.1 PREDICTED: phosphatidylinositol 5-phosphate 4-kinase type-2 beta-like isoform X2 [Amphimedon queenslandica]
MPGGVGKNKGASTGSVHQKSRHVKAKKQKKRFMRAKDPIQAVFMWGIQHSINEIMLQPEPSLLLEEDFKAFSKIRVENQHYSKEYLPGHFKFKEYCPIVFHDLRKRFKIDDYDYMSSLTQHAHLAMDNPGRSGSTFFVTSDKKLIIKSLSSEEVALLHQILQPYHAHIVTQEGQTLLPQYLGMYRLTVNSAETYWIVMRNILSHKYKTHLKFDLKGSTVDRAASEKEKAKIRPTLKDNDFIQMERKIMIGDASKASFLSILESDVGLLEKLNLMDYSLLVGITDFGAAPTDSDDEEWLDDDDVDFSGDELREDSPTSPLPDDMGKSNVEGEPTSPVPPTGASPPKAEELVVIKEDEVIEKPSGSPTGAASPVYRPILVNGEKEVVQAKADGYYPIIDKSVDIFAVLSLPESRKEVYYIAIIDVLTNYGARKRAAHAAKTMKHGHGAEISTVKPGQYARRFLDFVHKSIQ